MTSTPSQHLTEATLLTVAEAADLAGCSVDTIRRRRDSGAFPGAHQRGDGNRTWVVPVRDLVAGGLVAAAVLDPSTPEGAARAGVDPEMVALMTEVAALKARLDVQEARLADKDGDIAHLRSLTTAAARRKAS